MTSRLPTFVLDTSALDEATFVGSSYDQNDLTYDSAISNYAGLLTQFGIASAALGGLGAVATSSVSNVVSANAPLGELSTNATATVIHNATAESTFGGLSATANTLPTILPIFNATLGGLQAQATASVLANVIANAELGALEASASATVIPPTPPEPTPQAQGYGSNRPYAKPQPKPKPAPLPEPLKVVIKETPPARPVRMPATVVANANPITVTPSIEAQSRIEWSILEDEAELLLLI